MKIPMEHAPGAVLAQGRTAQIRLYGENRLLKIFKEGMPRAYAEFEFKAGRFAVKAGLPTPRPEQLLEWEDRPAIVYERLSGSTMLRRLAQKPWYLFPDAAHMARLHVAVHRTGAGPDSGLPCLKEALREKIEAAPILSLEEKAAVLAGLDKLPVGRQLLHGDLHPGNIMIDGRKGWIIDWMTASYGHPAADAARTVLMLRTGSPPEESSRAFELILASVRKLLLSRYLRTYLRLSGLERGELEAWMPALAAARLTEWLPPDEKLSLAGIVRDSLRQA